MNIFNPKTVSVGDLFIGALVAHAVYRVDLSGGEAVAEEVLFAELDTRIRDVRNGPGGGLYILTPDSVVRAKGR